MLLEQKHLYLRTHTASSSVCTPAIGVINNIAFAGFVLTRYFGLLREFTRFEFVFAVSLSKVGIVEGNVWLELVFALQP